MITFHEGLPGSGKSYEALIAHIIPNVNKGRKIFAYIEGINHQKIAELTEKAVEEVESLVVQVNRDDVHKIYDVVENDSFVIIDELQNFFPSGRQKLDDDITKFVTEHRHRGIDILTMGQSLADCHNLWRRRTEVKMTFTKLSAVGKSDSYKWQAYRGHLKSDGNIRYEKIRSGVKKYDEKYFGSYASHTSDTSNTDDYLDDRANVFKSPVFRYVLPAFFLFGCYAIYYLVVFFTGESSVSEASETVKINKANSVKIDQEQLKKAPVFKSAYVDYFDEIMTNNKPRLVGVIDYGVYSEAFIDVLDMTQHTIERFSSVDLSSYGWKASFTRFGVVLSKKGKEHLIRDFPVDGFGTINDNVETSLAAN